MRELILRRMAELRTTWGADLFGRPNRKGNLPNGVCWPIDFDFTKLTDAELVQEFERLAYRSYRQR